MRTGHGTSAVFRALVAGVEALQQRLLAAVRGDPYEALRPVARRSGRADLGDGVVRRSAQEAVS
nr:hypothetical protein [Deltaproteobacteria bacterium]